MTEKYRVHKLVKYNYTDIGEYIDENHTDKPLRNDEVAELLNELHEENERLRKDSTVLILANQNYRKENEQLKKDILRLMYTAEHLVNIKKLEEKWGIDYNQFLSDLLNGDEHL